MCDYSLCGIPNRLAVEGEDLLVHRFSTGSMGLASLADLRECKRIKETAPRRSLWHRLSDWLQQADQFANAPAVCIPPGAQLTVRNIPEALQRRFHLEQEETAVFTQLTSESNRYRDAVRFHGDCEILLQYLPEGMPMQVVSLEGATERVPPTVTLAS
jgi:hypothetical protein